MITTKLSRERRLGMAALQSLSEGKSADGQSIDLATIALNAHRNAQDHIRAIAAGQARTARKLRGCRFTG